MAGTKLKISAVSLAVLALVMAAALQSEAQMTPTETCAAQLGNINVCAPYVMSGAANQNPGADCCAALQSVNHDCICDTLRVSASLPTQCNLPPLSCPT